MPYLQHIIWSILVHWQPSQHSQDRRKCQRIAYMLLKIPAALPADTPPRPSVLCSAPLPHQYPSSYWEALQAKPQIGFSRPPQPLSAPMWSAAAPDFRQTYYRWHKFPITPLYPLYLTNPQHWLTPAIIHTQSNITRNSLISLTVNIARFLHQEHKKCAAVTMYNKINLHKCESTKCCLARVDWERGKRVQVYFYKCRIKA